MKSKLIILLLFILTAYRESFTQSDGYDVTLAPFSTRTNDEFSPVYFNNGIVFCSNLKNNSLIAYKNQQDKFFNIFYAELKNDSGLKNTRIFAKELSTNFNDGPVTFNGSGDVIFYCRNNKIPDFYKDFSDSANTLGIFSAGRVNGIWKDIQPFPYNSLSYSVITPAISPEGNILYFASDMPGGYGGTDIYYCKRIGNEWEKPVNLGSAINTQGNESYPFYCKSDKLFFASDGHGGLGEKDIFYTIEVNGEWIEPVHLAPGINSQYNDFGIVTDEYLQNGYFSSDRRKNDDIYSFKAVEMQFEECDSMTENKYCYSFYDAFQVTNDTIPVKYIWDFGQGIKKQGVTVKHCFPGPGSYEVKLFIIDSVMADSVINQTAYRFELKDAEQVYINTHQAGIVNKELRFDGLKTNLPGFKVNEYLWDFGSGFRARGPVASFTFTQKGEYIVQLGLVSEKDSAGNFEKACTWRSIRIYEDYQELATHTATELHDLEELYTYIGYKDINSANKATDVSETIHNTATKVLVPLKTVVLLTNDIPEYQKREIFNNLYGIADSELYMDTNAIDASSSEKLLPFVHLFKNNPNLKLEIAVHIYYHDFSDKNLIQSESMAANLKLFFADHDITPCILSCKGYGDLRPYPDKTTETNTDKTNRVEFIFIDNEH